MKKRNLDSNVNDKIRAKNKRLLLQDIGLMFFLAGLTAAAMLVAFSQSDEMRTENVLMLLVMSAAILLAAYRFRYLAVVACMVQTCFYAAYRIYMGFMAGQSIPPASYGWLVLPAMTVGAMTVFMQSTYQAEVIAEMLDKQLGEQVMVDRVTGLYNLKAMYIDLERQMSHSRRNGLNMTLMIMELRYRDELKDILTAAQFDTLRTIVSQVVEDCVRLEDRVYALDEDGKLGIMCMCDRPGAEIIKGRIKKTLETTKQFQTVLDRALRVELRVGIFEYKQDLVENAIDLKKKAENEMQYDV